jgi:dihydrofolate synthase/folylpolyglutamate synthase
MVITGLFVSPHLASYRERIQVDARLISEEDVLQHLPRVLERCVELNIPATLFEVTFILACLHYQATDCQAVVLEVLVKYNE